MISSCNHEIQSMVLEYIFFAKGYAIVSRQDWYISCSGRVMKATEGVREHPKVQEIMLLISGISHKEEIKYKIDCVCRIRVMTHYELNI